MILSSSLVRPQSEELGLQVSNVDPLQQLELNQQQQTFKVSALRVIVENRRIIFVVFSIGIATLRRQFLLIYKRFIYLNFCLQLQMEEKGKPPFLEGYKEGPHSLISGE